MLLFLMAISSKVVSLLRNSAHYINADQQPLNCDKLFIGDINIVKDKCSNRYIRNILKKNFMPCSTVFWSSKYDNIEWKKVWSITNKFFISNKVKRYLLKYYTEFTLLKNYLKDSNWIWKTPVIFVVLLKNL